MPSAYNKVDITYLWATIIIAVDITIVLKKSPHQIIGHLYYSGHISSYSTDISVEIQLNVASVRKRNVMVHTAG